jgi:hypothetical protein
MEPTTATSTAGMALQVAEGTISNGTALYKFIQDPKRVGGTVREFRPFGSWLKSFRWTTSQRDGRTQLDVFSTIISVLPGPHLIHLGFAPALHCLRPYFESLVEALLSTRVGIPRQRCSKSGLSGVLQAYDLVSGMRSTGTKRRWGDQQRRW